MYEAAIITGQSSVGGVRVPIFQAKTSMLPPVGGNNFGIILPNCMVDFSKHVPAAKLSFSF